MTRRRRRILRGAMWASAACGALAATAWLLSGWYEFGCMYSGTHRIVRLTAQYGSLSIVCESGWNGARAPSTEGIWSRSDYPWSVRGAWHVDCDEGQPWVIVPLWFITLLLVAPAFLCFRLSRPPIPGLCPRCGYDLSGSPTGVCPECGKAAGS